MIKHHLPCRRLRTSLARLVAGLLIASAVQAAEPTEAAGQPVASESPRVQQTAAFLSGTTVTVIAFGLGSNPEAAVASARLNAIQQTLGTQLSADELVEHEAVVEKHFLSGVAAYIGAHEVLATKQNPDGLLVCKAKVVVLKEKLQQTLRDLDLPVRGLISSLLDESISNDEIDSLSLTKALRALPTRLLRVDAMSTAPRIVARDASTVTAEWILSVGYDTQEYFGATAHVLDSLIDRLSLWRDAHPIRTGAGNRSGNAPYVIDTHLTGSSRGESAMATALALPRPENTFLVALNIGRNQHAGDLRWKIFVLDRKFLDCFSRNDVRVPMLRILLKDVKGSVVHAEFLNPMECRRASETGLDLAEYPWMVMPYPRDSVGRTAMLVWPFATGSRWRIPSQVEYSETVDVVYRVSLPIESIRKITSIETVLVDQLLD